MAVKDNLRIGDVEIYLDFSDGQGEQFLGQTNGGVEFTYERETEELIVDKYGKTPMDIILTGNNLMLKCNLAEMTTLNKYYSMPEGKYAALGVDSKLGIGRTSGFSFASRQALMRLHPRKNIPSARDEDVYIFKAVPVDSIELPYKIDEQQVLAVTFKALVDETQPDGQLLGRVGDASIS